MMKYKNTTANWCRWLGGQDFGQLVALNKDATLGAALKIPYALDTAVVLAICDMRVKIASMIDGMPGAHMRRTAPARSIHQAQTAVPR